MLTEDYCSYEVSKLLKEKGFNIPTHTFYNPSKSHYIVKFDPCLIDRNAGTCVSAPTHQMAMKWLREVHNLHIVIYRYPTKFNDSDKKLWYSEVVTLTSPESIDKQLFLDEDFPTYEKACDVAITYCLTNLI